MSLAKEWSARVAVLREDPHLIEQVSRLMEPLTMIQGTANVASFEDVVSTAAQLVAILETHPDKPTTGNTGGLMAVRGPLVGYTLMLSAATVYADRLSPYTTARDYWNAGQEALLAQAAEADSATEEEGGKDKMGRA